MAFFSGKSGSVSIGEVDYAFGKWSIDLDANLPKMNNFLSGFQILVSGLISSKLTLSGPYDAGEMAFTAGNSYEFILAVSDTIAFTITYFVENIKIDDDIDDAARISLSGQSSGSFTPSVT
jgi:hypothetical protein